MKIKILPTLLLILIPLFTSAQIKSLILFPILYAKQIRQDKIEKSKNEKRLKKEKQFIDSVWNAHEIKKQILKKKQDSIYKIKDSIQKIKFMEEQKLKKEKDSLLKIQLKKMNLLLNYMIHFDNLYMVCQKIDFLPYLEE